MPDVRGGSVNARGQLITTNVGQCARCGRDHHGLDVKQFERPVIIEGRTLDYWATCPVTYDPILVGVVEVEANA